MARYLGVSDRTVRRWVAGKSLPAVWVRDALLRRSDEMKVTLRTVEQTLIAQGG